MLIMLSTCTVDVSEQWKNCAPKQECFSGNVWNNSALNHCWITQAKL